MIQKQLNAASLLAGTVSLITAFCLALGGLVVSAQEPSGSTTDLSVSGYAAVKSSGRPAGKVEKGDRITVTIDARKEGLTTESAGKVTVSATSDSFRIPKGGVSVQAVSGAGEAMALKIKLSDLVYKGEGDSIRFKVSYGGGGQDTGEVHIYECVEYEKPSSKDSSSGDDDKDKKETHYGAPPILISHNPLGKSLAPGQEFQLKIRLQNLSPKLAAANLMVSLEPSDGIQLLDNSATRYLQSLRPKRDETITVQLRANKEIENPSQSLTVNVKYDYVENDQRASSTASDKLLLAFDEDLVGKSNIATPNVIINKYTYGESVAVGEVFDLALELKNTNPEVPVENLVMTLETGEGLSVTDSSNTFFYPEMAAGGLLSRTIRVQALPVATGSKPDYKIEVSFKYEYVAGGKRTPVTASEKIAIPVYQPDRFKVSPPTPPEEFMEGVEATISLPYVNKGKSEVSNVEAELSGEVDALETHQNLGNFEVGKSGTIDFVVKPRSAGTVNLQIKVTYEDSNMKVKTLDFPIKLTAAPAVPDFGMLADREEEPPTPDSRWIIWAVAAAVLFLLACLFLWRKHRKKRLQEASKVTIAWESEGDTDESA